MHANSLRVGAAMLVAAALAIGASAPAHATGFTPYCRYQCTDGGGHPVTICVKCLGSKDDACPLITTFVVRGSDEVLGSCTVAAPLCVDCESQFPNDARYRRGTELRRDQCPTVDDGLDNDGDGRVDEELCDGRDNDGDGKIDEDTYENELLSLAATPALGGPGTLGLGLALMILGSALALRRGRRAA